MRVPRVVRLVIAAIYVAALLAACAPPDLTYARAGGVWHASPIVASSPVDRVPQAPRPMQQLAPSFVAVHAGDDASAGSVSAIETSERRELDVRTRSARPNMRVPRMHAGDPPRA